MWSRLIWKFSKNSSDFENPGTPKLAVFPNSLQPELVKPETIKFVPTSSCPAKEDGGRVVLLGGAFQLLEQQRERAGTCVGSTTSSVLGNLTSRFDTLGQAASEL